MINPTTTYTPIFFSMPFELKKRIFYYVLKTKGNLNCRLICKNFLHPTNEAIKELWLVIAKDPPTGPVDLSLAIEKIQKDVTFRGKVFQKNTNYLHLFRLLNQEWKIRGIEIPEGELNIHYDDFAALQAQFHQRCLNLSLMSMWNRVWPQMSLFVESWTNCEKIRNWLNCLKQYVDSSVLISSLS